MYAQIVVDCQTQNESVNCEDCIVKSRCQLRFKLEETTKNPLESPHEETQLFCGSLPEIVQ